jgi:hypothetical protein
MTTFETEKLAELIRRKHDCLTQLHAMGARQMELVQEGSMAELLDVLSAKQRSIDELQRLQKALDPFRGQAPEGRQWRTPEDRQQCAETIQRCEVLLGEIIQQEKRSTDELVRRRDEAAARLQEVHRASHVRGAYTAQADPNAGQLNLLSES